MILKSILLSIVILVQLIEIRCDERIYSSSLVHSIQDEIFDEMISVTQKEWNRTATEHQNFHTLPVLLKMGKYCNQIKSYYENHPNSNRESRDRSLEKQYTFGKMLSEIRTTSSIRVNTPNFIIYDRRNTSEDYVSDIRTYYQALLKEESFDPENERWLWFEINNWYEFEFKSIPLRPKKSTTITSAGFSYHAMESTLRACWYTDKTTMTRISMLGSRYLATAVAASTSAKQTVEVQVFDEVEGFSATGNLTYFHNMEKNYEALKVPFNRINQKEEFATIFMLPYNNRSLDIFRNFTPADFRLLFSELNRHENYENVHFEIPIINAKTFYINQLGVGVNDKFTACEKVVESHYDATALRYRSFHVDRPFGVIIYHVPTQYVFLYALVRDVSSEASIQGQPIE